MHDLMNLNDDLQVKVSSIKESKNSEIAEGHEVFYTEIQSVREQCRKRIETVELESREQCRQVREDREYQLTALQQQLKE